MIVCVVSERREKRVVGGLRQPTATARASAMEAVFLSIVLMRAFWTEYLVEMRQTIVAGRLGKREC